MPPRAYSYVRFSTPEQMKSDSFRRQVEAAEKYAAKHGLEMDTQFTFHDLGVSAFKGRNKAEGMLGEFLAYVRSGDVPQGSYLLVENLDRVSRDYALDALDTLKDIAKAGITVVTLNDGKAYTHESLRQNPIDLLVAVMMFMRANEESATKGKRVGDAWANKRRIARQEGRPMTRLCPGWMRLRDDRSGYDLIEDRADVVRRIFKLTIEGRGQHWIADTLNREGIPVFGRGKMWHRSYIKKMLHDRATIGTNKPHRKVDGERIPDGEPIEEYFPAVIDRDVFDRVEELRRERAQSPTPRNTSVVPGRITHMLAGLATCPRCRATMTRVAKGNRSKPKYVCVKAKAGAGCQYRSVPVADVEEAITAQAYRFEAEMPSADDSLQIERESLETALGGIGDWIDNTLDAIGRSPASQALLDRLTELEAERAATRERLEAVELDIATTSTNRLQNTVGRLCEALEEGDMLEANAQLRSLFSGVTIDWPEGAVRFHWKHVEGAETSITYAWEDRTSAD